MSNKKILLALLSLCLVAMTTFNCGKDDDEPTPPPPPDPGAVAGKVSNEYGQLLTGAVVAIQGNGVNTSVATGGGEYILRSLAPGSYNLLVKKDGYIEASTAISITAGDTTTKDFVLKAGTAYFNLLSDTVLLAHGFAAPYKIKVASNTSWVINSSNDWITPAKQGSSGEDSIVVRIAASLLDTVRQGLLVLQAGSIVKNIVVKQVPEIKLRHAVPIPGNMAKGIKDSIGLTFNSPVIITSIFPGVSYCQSDIRFTYAGNKVTFSYACGAIGGDYPFTIATVNSLGDQYTFTVNVGFYEKAINLTGTIQSHFVNDADNSYWIITDHPNALYKIDMTSFEILHRYDLPDEPAMFTVSPYDNKIYLAYRRIPKLYIMGQNGVTEKVIDIARDTSRHFYEYYGPHIHPSRIAFTKSGKGMIWLDDLSYGDSPYWFIDAAADHRIWYEALPGAALYYNDGKVNYDKTKLVLTYPNSDATIGTFDPQLMAFSSYKPTKTTGGVSVTPSRKNANVYSGQLYNQLIVNPATGFESLGSNVGNYGAGTMDFCYKPGKDLTVYYGNEARIEVIDYSTGSMPVVYDALYYLRGTTATLDGQHVIFYRHDGNYNAKVVQIRSSWFD